MEKKNYYSMIGKTNDSFGDNGWADGYADFPNDCNELISQLYDKIEIKDLINYLNEYLMGYEMGSFLSKEADSIYDEDGCILEEIDLSPSDHEDDAKDYIIEYEQKVLHKEDTLKKIDYYSIIKEKNSLYDIGYFDGYGSFLNASTEIINQLYKKLDKELLIEYISEYLMGYDNGYNYDFIKPSNQASKNKSLYKEKAMSLIMEKEIIKNE